MDRIPQTDFLVPCLPVRLGYRESNRRRVPAKTSFEISEAEKALISKTNSDALFEYFGPNLWRPWRDLAPVELESDDEQLKNELFEVLESHLKPQGDLWLAPPIPRPNLEHNFRPILDLEPVPEPPLPDFEDELFGFDFLYPVFDIPRAAVPSQTLLQKKAEKVLKDMLDLPSKLSQMKLYPLSHPMALFEGEENPFKFITSEAETQFDPLAVDGIIIECPKFNDIIARLMPTIEEELVVDDPDEFLEHTFRTVDSNLRTLIARQRKEATNMAQEVVLEMVDHIPIVNIIEDKSVHEPPNLFIPTMSADRGHLASLTAKMRLDSHPGPKTEGLNSSANSTMTTGKRKLKGIRIIHLDPLIPPGLGPIRKRNFRSIPSIPSSSKLAEQFRRLPQSTPIRTFSPQGVEPEFQIQPSIPKTRKPKKRVLSSKPVSLGQFTGL